MSLLGVPTAVNLGSPTMAAALDFTSFSCVHYASGDLLGKALAYCSLLPLLLVFFQACKVYTRRCGLVEGACLSDCTPCAAGAPRPHPHPPLPPALAPPMRGAGPC